MKKPLPYLEQQLFDKLYVDISHPRNEYSFAHKGNSILLIPYQKSCKVERNFFNYPEYKTDGFSQANSTLLIASIALRVLTEGKTGFGLRFNETYSELFQRNKWKLNENEQLSELIKMLENMLSDVSKKRPSLLDFYDLLDEIKRSSLKTKTLKCEIGKIKKKQMCIGGIPRFGQLISNDESTLQQLKANIEYIKQEMTKFNKHFNLNEEKENQAYESILRYPAACESIWRSSIILKNNKNSIGAGETSFQKNSELTIPKRMSEPDLSKSNNIIHVCSKRRKRTDASESEIDKQVILNYRKGYRIVSSDNLPVKIKAALVPLLKEMNKSLKKKEDKSR